eukprot:TRINITY_DN2867_c0_g1_i4.p1 TRINITY_DN2867_c0_g1~~TRINITY_DN2867_c0_g1_i4.p1  ORF type:complete len:224 (+),score=43.52 TRINITY_DN2867_c0_g1_i4:308-979(+)
MWGWLNEEFCGMLAVFCPNFTQSNTSFDGVLSLPREIGIDNSGALLFWPPNELQALRMSVQRTTPATKIASDPGAELRLTLPVHAGRTVEILTRFAAGWDAEEFGFTVLSDGTPAEATRIGYNASAKQVFIDQRNATAGPVSGEWVYTAPLDLMGEDLVMHCFVDMSVIEVFFGASNAPTVGLQYQRVISARTYTSKISSDMTELFAVGGSVEVTVQSWQLGL